MKINVVQLKYIAIGIRFFRNSPCIGYVRYNANKALMNLGFEPLFPDTAEDVNPIVINGLSTGTTNHDFFSTVGNGYLLSEVEEMQDSDYDY